MLRYTARNGTTFHLDPDACGCVHVISADHEGPPIPVDLDDMREFLQHLDELSGMMSGFETDADMTAIGPD